MGTFMEKPINRLTLIPILVGVLMATIVGGFTASPATAAATDFITTWTTSANPTISLAFSDTATDLDFSIDWGDGSSVGPYSQLSGASITHTYTGSVATRQITVSGSKIPGWNLYSVPASKDLLVSVDQWGGFRFGDQGDGGYFLGASNLTTIGAADAPDLTGVTRLANMFDSAIRLTAITNASLWDTSQVTNMFSMFYYAQAFDSDLGNWDTSQVQNMVQMFEGATLFDRNIGNWDTSQVTQMAGMFRDTQTFNQDIGNWDTSQVTDMSLMFDGASTFNKFIGDWDTSQVTDMFRMFTDARLFSQYIGAWDTSQVTDMSRMFDGALSFNQYIGAWDTSQVTDMHSMFEDAVYFNQYIGAWDISQVTDMDGMFDGALLFNQDIGNWDTTQVTDMSLMFNDARTFNRDISSWDTTQVTDMDAMFSNATDMSVDLTRWCVADISSKPYNFDYIANNLRSLPYWGQSLCAPSPATLASTTSGVIDVTWQSRVAPSNGTSPTGYSIEIASGGPFVPVSSGTCATASTSTATSCTISALTPGSTVFVQLTALDSVGAISLSETTSPRSVIVSSYTPPAPAPTPDPGPAPSDSGSSTSQADSLMTDSVVDPTSINPNTQGNSLASCQFTPSSGNRVSTLNLVVTANDGSSNSGFLSSTTTEACSLSVTAGSRIKIGVDGFQPGTPVFAYLLPTPNLLARVIASENGRVEISALIPANTSLGNHILQLSGQLSATEPAVASVGLTVRPAGDTKLIALKLTYGKNAVLLSSKQRTQIRRYVSSHKLNSIRVMYSTNGTQKSNGKSLKRAKAAASYIDDLPGVSSVTLQGSKKVKESVVFIR